MSANRSNQQGKEKITDRTRELIRRRPTYASWKFWLSAIIVLLVYVYGWHVTQINLKTLVKDAHLVRPLVSDLLRPDFIARNMNMQQVKADFQMPCTSNPPKNATPQPGKPVMIVSKTCGKVGDELTVKASGLRPNTKGRLWWEDPIGQRDLIMEAQSDANGNFEATFKIPEVRSGEGEISHIVLELKWPGRGFHFTKTAKLVLNKIIETIFLALMATTLAIFIAIPISFLAARNLMSGSLVGRIVYYITRTFLNIFRSIEPLIWGLIFVVWVGIGPFAGVLALTVHSIAALGKLYSEAIESIDPGPIEAITATGANKLQVIVYGVIPQMIPPFIAFTLYRWDINVRMSTVIGLVGGGGIGFLLIQWINLMQFRQAAAAIWAITLVVWALDYASAIVREKLV